MSFIYIATPYTHPSAAVREMRYAVVNDFAAKLMISEIPVFSPISHSHDLARYMPEEYASDPDFWTRMDLPILERAAGMVVLRQEGWDKSRGVREEVVFAHECNIAVVHVDLDRWQNIVPWCARMLEQYAETA